VALKMVHTRSSDPREAEFFRAAINNEVEVLKRFRHPNVVRIFPIPLGSRRATPFIARDHDIPGVPWYFVMEYLGGGSLKGRIKRRKKLPVLEAVEVASQVAMALEYLHSKGIAHRDIKPDNVLFRVDIEATGRIEPVLVDFGIAAKLQRVGLQAGSVYYMSPERLQVVQGRLPPERATNQAAGDVYGLGVMLYQMLTGRLPFEGHNRSSVTSAILNSTPSLPRRYRAEIPPGLEQLMMETLNKDPAHRPTAEEALARMEQLVPSPRVAASDGAPVVKSSSRLPWFVSAVTTLGMIGMLAWNLTSNTPEPTPAPPQTIVVTRVITATSAPTVVIDQDAPVLDSPTATETAPEPTRPSAPPSATVRASPTPVPTRTPRPTLTPESKATTFPSG
jgi:serine/threonine-protein kinase